MSDGGEGLLDALGGRSRHTTVSGPLGQPVDAEWRLLPTTPPTRRPAATAGPLTAVIEMSKASGRALVPRPRARRPRRRRHDRRRSAPPRRTRRGSPPHRRRLRRLGHHRRWLGCLRRRDRHRTGRTADATARRHRARGRLRRHHPLPPGSHRLRPAEGRHRGTGRPSHRPPRRGRRPLPQPSPASTSPPSPAPARPEAWPVAWWPWAPASSRASTSWPASCTWPSASSGPTSSSPARATSTRPASRARSPAASLQPGPQPSTRARAHAVPVPVVCIGGGADASVAGRPPARPRGHQPHRRLRPERARNDTLELIAEVTTRLLPRFCP